MSDIAIDESSKSKEINQSDNKKQVNIKNEPQEIENTEFLNTATKSESNNEVVHVKEELKIKIEETEEKVIIKDEVAGAVATDVKDKVNIKREYTDITENVYDQELVIDNEGIRKIKSEVDKSEISCEVTKEVNWDMVTRVPCKELKVSLDDVDLDSNNKQLTDNAPTTEYNQNAIHHLPIKTETLIADKNIFSTCNNENIGENLNAIDSGKICNTINLRSEALPHCKQREIVKDVMLTESKHTQDSLVQLTAQSTTKNKNIIMDSEKISTTAAVTTGTIEDNIDTKTTKKMSLGDIYDKQFGTQKIVLRSIRKRSKIYSCTYCTFKTTYKSYLKKHVKSAHPNSTVFICDYCGFECHLRKVLSEHINRNHNQNASYNCVYCSYVTYRKATLREHINAEHTKTTVFICSYCTFKTYRKYKLNAHVKIEHTNISFRCSLCSYKTNEEINYTRHVNIKHTTKNVYNCSHCEYKTSEKSNLSRHINAKHTKTKVYNCSLCSYVAYNKLTLTKHVNAKHTKTNVYNCSLCSYKAYDKSTLSKHVNAKHNKTVFNYSCCTFETPYQLYFTRHIKTLHS